MINSAEGYETLDDVEDEIDAAGEREILLDVEEISAPEIKICCGFTKAQLQSIQKQTNNLLPRNKLKLQQLFVAFTIWRNNLHYRFAGVLFGYSGPSGIAYVVDKVINALYEQYVPKYVGFPAWNQQKVEEEIPEFVRTLYPEDVIPGVVDCTYLYSERSRSNYQFQRCTYAGYKGRHLEKVQVCCTPSGKVIFIDGPFFADKSNDDKTIWDRSVYDDDHPMHKIFDKTRHTIVADRGYMGCIDGADWYKLIWTSKWHEKIAKQLTTQEANESRHVTSY